MTTPGRPLGALRSLPVVLVAAFVATILVGCGGGSDGGGPDVGGPAAEGSADLSIPADVPPVSELPVTVTSADGRQVTVTDTSRILPLTGSIAEVVFALGLGDQVVGRDISATFDEAAGLPLVTRAHDVSAESVLSLRPTLVLADTESGPPEALNHLRNVGLPVVVIERATTIDDIGPRIVAVAEAVGITSAGEELARRTTDEIETISGEADASGAAPRVAFLYLRGQAGVYLMGGPDAGTDAMIEAAGGVDAGTELGLDKAFTPLTSEALVRAAPDVLLLTTTGLESVGGVDGLLEIRGIAQTPAGVARRVATVEDGLLFGFGTRTPDALRVLVAQLERAQAQS